MLPNVSGNRGLGANVPSPSRLAWSLEYVFLNAINCCWLARKSGPISLFE